jgi:VWFA-related protein
MRSAGPGAVAATISLLFLVGLGTAQPLASSAPASILAQSATTSMDPTQQALPTNVEGRIHLDVVVRDAAGKPVSGLRAQDFKLLDDGKDRVLSSFAAYDGLQAKPDPPVQMILVIDCVNNGFVELGYIRQGLTKFLRQNDGHLAQPTTIVRFTLSGVDFLSQPSTDGDALANVVDKIGATTKPGGLEYFSLSLKALSTLMNQEANEPGRKLLIWLGPGWPTPAPIGQVFTKIDARDQRADYKLTVQYARAMEQGRIALYGGNAAADFYMRDYLKPVRKVSEADPRNLSLDVLAVKSGGHGELSGVNRDSAVTDILNNFAAEASTFYSLSYDPPRARRADEFHELKVVLDQPGLKARTITGYYDEPEYFRPEPKKEKTVIAQQPDIDERSALQPVSVAELTEIVERVKSRHDAEAAKEIEHLRLTERLSSPKLTALIADLPGAKAKAALMVVGDASAFLEPPEAEIPKRAVPNMTEQRQIVSLAVDYLKKILPKLPDFYAKRFTTSFEEVWAPKDEKDMHQGGALHPVGEFRAMVYYRGGKEVVHAEGAEQFGLITQGTFGPILNTVIGDAAHGSTQWSRWEEGPNGPMAVFRIQVPREESHYEVSSSSLVPGIDEIFAMGGTAYHGEIGIDPVSGAILRLVLEADPDSGSSMKRADIMVEYGSVEIGGQVYTCPLRSVSYSVGMLNVPVSLDVQTSWKREATRLNDVVFSGYHVFRSDMRILPE